MKLSEIINHLRASYKNNKCHYEFLFSVLYYTDEDYIIDNFLRKGNNMNRVEKVRHEQSIQIVEERKFSKKVIKYNCNVNFFKKIFGKDFIKNKPLSFLDSFILCCCDQNIGGSSNVKTILLKKLLTDFDTCELYKEYNCRKRKGFNKRVLRSFFENESKIDDDPMLIRFLCDYFKMNICVIIVDEYKKDILFYSSNDKFSIYKSTIIIEKKSSNMYQYYMMSNKETIFNSNSTFIYRLLNYKIEKDFMKRLIEFNKINENNKLIELKKKSLLDRVIKEEKTTKENEETNIIGNDQNKTSKTNKYDYKKLMRLKLNALQKICKKENVNHQKKNKKGVNLKNKTKSELAKELVNLK